MARHTIAVVDNAESIRAMLHDLLTFAGYTVVTAPIAPDTVTWLCATPPDLILLDLPAGYPALALSLLHQLKHAPQTAHLPLLVGSTDYGLLDRHAAVFARWQVPTFRKPFVVDELLRLIAQQIQAPCPAPASRPR